MGTRNLTVVVNKRGDMKVAQYGQWDGYPSGQGKTILNFLRAMIDADTLDVFNAKLENVAWMPDGVAEKMDEVIKCYQERFPKDISPVQRLFPEVSRDTGGAILRLIFERCSEWPRDEKLYLQNEIAFALDGLFCEWAYIVDLKRRTFEVYQGFNRGSVAPSAMDELIERYDSKHERGERGENDGYRAVGLVATFKFAELPTDEEFLELENYDVEEEVA